MDSTNTAATAPETTRDAPFPESTVMPPLPPYPAPWQEAANPAPPVVPPRPLLKQPKFWAAMLLLTVVMFIGMTALSEHLKVQRNTIEPAGKLYYAAQR